MRTLRVKFFMPRHILSSNKNMCQKSFFSVVCSNFEYVRKDTGQVSFRVLCFYVLIRIAHALDDRFFGKRKICHNFNNKIIADL